MKTMNEIIFSTKSPWDNPYQGKDKKVVFVYSAGILRSATAARLYAGKYNTRACGSEEYTLIKLSDDLVCWADQIVFVNEENYMRKINYPHFEKHKTSHRYIMDSINNFVKELLDLEENMFEREFVRIINITFVHHIINEDKKIINWEKVNLLS